MRQWIHRISPLLSLVAIAMTIATAARAADDDKEAPKQEWVSLFDGETLSGWTLLELGDPGSSHWEVKDGAMVGTGKPSMLFSPKGDYKNFRYKAELKINDHGNSGMYVRAEKAASFTKGYEIQVNSTHTDPIRTGSVYQHVHIFKELVKPDTWFTQEVELVNKEYRGKVLPHFTIIVNGEVIYQFIDHAKEFMNAGHFAFQQHDPGSVIQIRKVEVMELPDDEKK